MDDIALRSLADWSKEHDRLAPLKSRIALLWKELRDLRLQVKNDQQSLDIQAASLSSVERRFWSKVEIIDDDDSCWEWKGGRRPVNGEEYGLFRLESHRSGNGHGTIGAHRFAYVLANGGEIPEVARHTCDNPPCCRPSHLIAGSHADNMRDRQERGRYSGQGTNFRGRGIKRVQGEPIRAREQQGEANDSAVLTDAIVIDARRRSKAGETQKVIADEYGVSVAVLGYAIRGKTWNHLDERESPHVRPQGGGSRLTEDDVRAIRSAHAAAATRSARGDVARALAAEHKVSVANIHAIVRRKSWAHVE